MPPCALPAAAPTATSEGIRTRRRTVQARTPGQRGYLAALRERDMVFALGPAGSGKTYLAVAMGVSLLLAGKVERIVLSRPAVEAGERLGFLPGDMKEKIDPYLRPLYDALHDMVPAEQIANRMESGEIEIAPLAFMRGRTLAHCFVILDEAQNTTPMQMRMFLTRLGEGSRMVITGDPSQTDLPGGQRSGLNDAVETLKDVNGMRFVRLTSQDVVRHDLVTRIVEAYDARDKKAKRPELAARSSCSTRRGTRRCRVSSGWCARPRAPPSGADAAQEIAHRGPGRRQARASAEHARPQEGQADQRAVLSVGRTGLPGRCRAGAPDRVARGKGAEEDAGRSCHPSCGARHAASAGPRS